MKPKFRFSVCIASVFALLNFSSLGAQKITDRKPDGVFKSRGWAIPHLKELKEGARRLLLKLDSEGKRALYITRLTAKGDEMLLYDTACYVKNGDRRELVESPIAVNGFDRIDVNGHMFCYIAYGTGVSILRNRKERSSFVFLGCQTGYAYYDLDGGGKLTLLARSNPLAQAEIYIPAWATAKSQ